MSPFLKGTGSPPSRLHSQQQADVNCSLRVELTDATPAQGPNVGWPVAERHGRLMTSHYTAELAGCTPGLAVAHQS